MSYAQTTTLMKLVDASDSPLILMPGGTRSGKTIATLMYLTAISERTQNNLIGITYYGQTFQTVPLKHNRLKG